MLLKVAQYQAPHKEGIKFLIENGPWKGFEKLYKISKVSLRPAVYNFKYH